MARIDVLDRSCHCAGFRIRCLSSCRYETLIKAIWRRRKYLFWLEVQGYSRHSEEVMVAGSLASWSHSIWGQGAERKCRYFSLLFSFRPTGLILLSKVRRGSSTSISQVRNSLTDILGSWCPDESEAHQAEKINHSYWGYLCFLVHETWFSSHCLIFDMI